MASIKEWYEKDLPESPAGKLVGRLRGSSKGRSSDFEPVKAYEAKKQFPTLTAPRAKLETESSPRTATIAEKKVQGYASMVADAKKRKAAALKRRQAKSERALAAAKSAKGPETESSARTAKVEDPKLETESSERTATLEEKKPQGYTPKARPARKSALRRAIGGVGKYVGGVGRALAGKRVTKRAP